LNAFLSQSCGSLSRFNRLHRDNMAGQLDIRITSVGPDFIVGDMPVDERTRQPMGLLHGGASIVLAETLGSIASWTLVMGEAGARVAGIEVSGSHLKAVRSGRVTGVCRPLKLGRTLHFWRIDITDADGDPCCSARLTVSVSRKPGNA
jgi:1,4-dihydroxy-2-naphthoyl-CoA hydrolase